jgi:sec-independent protein translocase protein TatC
MTEKEFQKKKKNDTDKIMSFWEHLEVLRWHILRSAIAIVVFSTIAFFYKDIIFDKIILSPKEPGFITSQLLCRMGAWLNIPDLCINVKSLKIINTEMAGQFNMHIFISIVTGLILTVPYFLWELWRFIKPALSENERKHSGGFVIITSFLFLIGVVFSYFLIVPLTINFLGTYYVSENVENYFTLSSYINTITSLTFATGIVFELPVMVYFLTRIGILTPKFLKKYRRHAIVIILIIAAIITPPDVFSQTMVAIPLYLLFEISIYICKIVYRKKHAADIKV